MISNLTRSSAKQADAILGRRIKQRRLSLGITLDQAAKALGVSFQQIQKYESGDNRITAVRLELLARLFSVPVSHFHDEASESVERKVDDLDWLTWRMVRSFPKIKSKKLRMKLVVLVEEMADEPD